MAEAPPLAVRGERTPLLSTEALRNHLGELLARPPAKLLIVSAYVTKVGVDWLLQQTSGATINCDIVARWSPNDLLSGASDVEGCAMAMQKGWRFHVLPDLHAKVTLLDDTEIVVGSANLTGSGMSLVPASNREFGIAAKATPQDVLACRALLADAVQMTPDLLEAISVWVAANKIKSPSANPCFPDAICSQLQLVPTKLFTAELPWLPVSQLLDFLIKRSPATASRSLRHDLALLGVDEYYATSEAALSAISSSIENSRFWRWLTAAVSSQPNQEIWYGSITSLLHDALCDDPLPYRQDVKALVSNLYSYAEACGCGLQADRPNWSQRLMVDPARRQQ